MSNPKYNTYVIGPYIFTFHSDVTHETYSCEYYSGVIFDHNGDKYDIVNNPILGFRLLINETNGSCRDIPFKTATFWLLPESISVEEYEDK